MSKKIDGCAPTSKGGLRPTPDISHIKTFKEFFPVYLREHSDRTNRRLHFIGSTMGLVWFLLSIVFGAPLYILGGLVNGYAFAWVGHFFFERNKPATFKAPLWSFMGDWVMWSKILTGEIPF